MKTVFNENVLRPRAGCAPLFRSHGDDCLNARTPAGRMHAAHVEPLQIDCRKTRLLSFCMSVKKSSPTTRNVCNASVAFIWQKDRFILVAKRGQRARKEPIGE